MYRVTIASAILAVTVLTSVSASANDKEGVYVTVGGTLLSADLDLSGLEAAGQTVDLGEEDADIFMINGRVGYRFNDYFAVEGEIGFGTGGDDFDRTIPVDGGALGIIDVDANVELDVDNYYIGFARAIYPVSDQFDIFVRGGFGEANAEATVVASAFGQTASASASEDESGFAYGIGGQYNFTEKDGIRADFTLLDDVDIISLAYSRRF